MLMNNLDPDVAERPEDLVVYGGTGRAARSWPAFHAIVRSLRALEALHRGIRDRVPPLDEDRRQDQDLAALDRWIEDDGPALAARVPEL